jgi:ABC-type uncharacterized transport system involved in gliding motility auxiliary subunit
MHISKTGTNAALVLLSALFFNSILSHLPLQSDFSQCRQYTLSRESKKLLNSIEEPILLDFYFSRGSDQVPGAFKQFGNRIEVFLKQIERSADGLVQVRIIDPKPDTPEEESAMRSGVTSTPLPNGDRFFLGMVTSQADQESLIDLFSMQRESFLEYDIMKCLAEVQRLDLPRIGIISSLPIGGSPGAPGMGRQEPSEWIFLSQLRERFEVQMIPSGTPSIEDNLDLLLLMHPKGIDEKLMYSIDQFLLSGKPVIAALDPSSVMEKQGKNPQQLMMGMAGSTASDLKRLLQAWGIEFDPAQVVGDLSNAARVGSAMGQATPYPAWHSGNGVNPEIPAVAQLQQLLLIEPGAFALKQDSKLKLTPVVRSSEQSALIPSMSLIYPQPAETLKEVQLALRQGAGKSYHLAALIEGDFTSAFPLGAPENKSENAETTDEDAGETAAARTDHPPAIPNGKGTLLLIGDSDCFADRFSVESIDFIGKSMLRPINDNLNLLLNLCDHLTGQEELISLRGKQSMSRPFTRVQNLELEAQSRYQQQLDEVDAKLTTVQSELNRIQQEQQSNGMLVASNELQKALDDFRKQEADAVSERRVIRKQLREGIESLNRNLALINLFTVPVVLCGFALPYFLRRNRARR